VGLVRRRSPADSQSPHNPAIEDLNAGRRRVRARKSIYVRHVIITLLADRIIATALKYYISVDY